MSVKNQLLCSLFSPGSVGLAASVWSEAETPEDFLLLAMHFIVAGRSELLQSVVHRLDDQDMDRLVELILFVGMTRNLGPAFEAMERLSRLAPARPTLWSAFALLQMLGGHAHQALRSLAIHAALTGRTVEVADAAFPCSPPLAEPSIQIVRGDVDMWAPLGLALQP